LKASAKGSRDKMTSHLVRIQSKGIQSSPNFLSPIISHDGSNSSYWWIHTNLAIGSSRFFEDRTFGTDCSKPIFKSLLPIN